MRFAYALAIIFFSTISVFAQAGPQDVDTYEITTFAGVDTGQFDKDGIGENASFISTGPLWGDGRYLYVADGNSLRRIEIATRQVTTITRLAGTGNSFLSGMWGDGSNIYVSTLNVRRVNLSTTLVDPVAPNVQFRSLRGVVGDGRYLYVGNSFEHTIQRLDIAAGTLTNFASLPGPTDPNLCRPSDLNCFVPAPSSLSIDGNRIYATGFGTTLRIVNTSTAEVTSSPQLPFIPNSVWGNNGVLYYTEAGNNRIGKLVLATGEVSIIFGGAPGRTRFNSIWGDANSLYVAEVDHIIRLDLATGTIQPFAGTDPAVGSVDGVGTAARFNSAHIVVCNELIKQFFVPLKLKEVCLFSRPVW